jgi:polyhydroxyalkanoate synthesis regulator phasin
MKKYVFTIMDDVCAANGKDIEATELIEKMKLWGTVEDYEKVVASVRAEYQSIVDNLNAQLAAIKEQELTADEITLLNAYRGCKKITADIYQERIGALEKQLKELSEEQSKRLQRIAELLTP